MPNPHLPIFAYSSTDMIGASFATVNIDDDEFIISSCNQSFSEMVGKGNSLSFPALINDVFDDIDAGEFLYFLYLSTQDLCAIEYELSLTNNGIKHWWLMIITPLAGLEGQLLIIGINISEKKRLQDELGLSRNRYRSVIQSVHDCIVTIDSQSNVVIFNKSAEQIWGYSASEVVGKKITMLLPEGFRANHQGYVDGFAVSEVQSRKMTNRSIVYGLRKDGTTFPAEISISKMMVNSNVEFTAIIRDISERSRLLEELQEQALTDGLTRLNNRIYFEQEIKQKINLVTQDSQPLSLLLIDLDHFKLVNDTHGHAVGDQVLIAFSQQISKLMGPQQTFARYGGEEFIILLPNLNQQQAYQFGLEVCATSAQIQHVNDIRVTVSIGVSQFLIEQDDVDSFTNRADIALYQAKAAGRNGVKCYDMDNSPLTEINNVIS